MKRIIALGLVAIISGLITWAEYIYSNRKDLL